MSIAEELNKMAARTRRRRGFRRRPKAGGHPDPKASARRPAPPGRLAEAFGPKGGPHTVTQEPVQERSANAVLLNGPYSAAGRIPKEFAF